MLRLQRLRKFLLWCCLFVGASIIFRLYILNFPPGILIPYMRKDSSHAIGQQACIRPQLELDNPLINSFFKPVPAIECGDVADWICIQNGTAQLCDFVTSQLPNVRCNYSFFERSDDHGVYVTKEFKKVGPGIGVTMPSDFFHVRCDDDDDIAQRQWRSIMASIHRDQAVLATSSFLKVPDRALKLNVLMFGFDSLSRMTYMRKLPLTYRYLTEVLGAVVLQGYNIVGDGTPQALIPILTGSTEPELPETRKRMGNAQNVNVYPFVWNDFKQNGYVTGYAEDAPDIGTFTYRLKGFGEQPTDHYIRTFYVEAEKYFPEYEKLCLGNKPRHKVIMDYVEDFFDFYKDRPKFFFAFHSELSHSDYNLVGAADNDTMNMLKSLKNKGHLENTLLIMMSDHGHRFAQVRETQQGKQEERLPFLSIAVPPWFAQKHPVAHRNLMTNSERLTTPFDIYATFRSLLNFEELLKQGSIPVGSIKNRSRNLFSEVPKSRTCEDANIAPHWCTCLNWESVDIDDPLSKSASQFLVEYINDLTAQYRSICAPLSLNGIVRVEKFVPQLDMLRYKKNADADGFVGDFTDNTAISQVIYQVKIVTMPGTGHFESSLVYDVDKKAFTANSEQISRVNVYGSDADCIVDTNPDLRKYCYCVPKSTATKD